MKLTNLQELQSSPPLSTYTYLVFLFNWPTLLEFLQVRPVQKVGNCTFCMLEVLQRVKANMWFIQNKSTGLQY